MADDEQHDPKTAMERMNAFLGRIVSAGKKDVQKPRNASRKSWTRR